MHVLDDFAQDITGMPTSRPAGHGNCGNPDRRQSCVDSRARGVETGRGNGACRAVRAGSAPTATARGLTAIIAGAGGAAHLPGMLAAKTPVPVLGVPVASKHLQGVDSLHSIVQMPKGVPVATFAIGAAGAANAADDRPYSKVIVFGDSISDGGAYAAQALARRHPQLVERLLFFNCPTQSIAGRWVHDGRIWSSAGVSAGMDMALAFIAQTAGEDVAFRVQFGTEYFPEGRRYGDPAAHPQAPDYLKQAR